jgi:hypothetical protein
MARNAHAAVKRADELSCCGINFTSKVALRLHKRDHNKSRVYDED